jgi:hypothetical protein
MAFSALYEHARKLLPWNRRAKWYAELEPTHHTDAARTADYVAAMVKRLNRDSQPNINALWNISKDLALAQITIKHLGYELARQAMTNRPARAGSPHRNEPLLSKPATQGDLESDWVAHWAKCLETPLIYHRKLWELCYVTQAIYEAGLMTKGTRGLGFAVGEEPLPSYFASLGINITATDLQNAQGGVWQRPGANRNGTDKLFFPHLISRQGFDTHVVYEEVDMRKIPTHLRNFDFCWSVCSLEHLGSLQAGLDFIENSLDTLRHGGVAVHTTEFNFMNEKETIDNWGTVLYQRKHFIELHDRLKALGHEVAKLDFDVGHGPLDKFIDLPPYLHDWDTVPTMWEHGQDHIKLAIDGFACTSFGLIIRRG